MAQYYIFVFWCPDKSLKQATVVGCSQNPPLTLRHHNTTPLGTLAIPYRMALILGPFDGRLEAIDCANAHLMRTRGVTSTIADAKAIAAVLPRMRCYERGDPLPVFPDVADDVEARGWLCHRIRANH